MKAKKYNLNVVPGFTKQKEPIRKYTGAICVTISSVYEVD